jgi:hypothetical protein
VVGRCVISRASLPRFPRTVQHFRESADTAIRVRRPVFWEFAQHGGDRSGS